MRYSVGKGWAYFGLSSFFRGILILIIQECQSYSQFHSSSSLLQIWQHSQHTFWFLLKCPRFIIFYRFLVHRRSTLITCCWRYVTLMSKKPCHHNYKCDCSITNLYKSSFGLSIKYKFMIFPIKYRYSNIFFEKSSTLFILLIMPDDQAFFTYPTEFNLTSVCIEDLSYQILKLEKSQEKVT